MKKNTGKQVEAEKGHAEVEEKAQTEQEEKMERRAPPPQPAQRMRPCQAQPQLRFPRSLAAPTNVMIQPTGAKMQEQEGCQEDVSGICGGGGGEAHHGGGGESGERCATAAGEYPLQMCSSLAAT